MESPRSTPLPNLAQHRRRRGLTQRALGELAVALGVEPGALVGGDRE